ncbi:MAG: OOP family OmpA-OmpF porin [Granulosicoccus sp.]
MKIYPPACVLASKKRYPYKEALVEGNTDSMGEDHFNFDLSRERTFAVSQALDNTGLSVSRLSTQGFGETLPVADTSTSTGRLKNRRIEIIFPDASIPVSE